MTGASSADSRISVTSAALEVDLRLVLGDGLGDRALERVEAADQVLDVDLGGDRDPAAQAGHHLDVVDGEDVRRVGHREEQRLGVDVADRDGVEAAGGLDRDEVRRAHVDVVGVEVDVVEPVALGDRAGELIGAEHPLLDHQRLRRAAGRPGLGDRLVDPLGGEVAELDDDVGDEAAAVGAGPRRRQPGRAAPARAAGRAPPSRRRSSGTARR